MIQNLILMIFTIVGLTACTANPVDLPLVDGKLALIFFYTEN